MGHDEKTVLSFLKISSWRTLSRTFLPACSCARVLRPFFHPCLATVQPPCPSRFCAPLSALTLLPVARLHHFSRPLLHNFLAELMLTRVTLHPFCSQPSLSGHAARRATSGAATLQKIRLFLCKTWLNMGLGGSGIHRLGDLHTNDLCTRQ